MKYFFIAGEASGDLHASRLMEALKKAEPQARFAGMGGDRMAAAGCMIVRHISDMAFMGIVDVVRHASTIRRNMSIARAALTKQRPDVLVLIDYPSFNLRMAAFCRKHLPDTKIVYYIPPKVWAWKRWRVHRIARLTDLVLCIFPFEKDFYRSYGYEAVYAGNPTCEELQDTIAETLNAEEKPADEYIAVLPGSRRHEVKQCLKRMTEAALRQKGYEVVVARTSAVEEQVYTDILKQTDSSRIRLVTDKTRAVVAGAKAAVVNSGTATLETALLGCPQAAVYHLAVGRLLYKFKPLLFKIPYFTLVNIIAGEEVIKEWLAYRFTTDNVAADLSDILGNDSRRERMLQGYEKIRSALGASHASAEAAQEILRLLQH